ncbi:hypothetical protein BKA93DRAFT_821905 [Sparassis latifolia]
MVHLLLAPLKGNSASSRSFPYHGYLGLTPVSVEGTVRTSLDEDGKTIPAKTLTISIRCYESRVGRFRSTVHTKLVVDHTETLWSKPDSADWADVGVLDFPFKLTLPKRIHGFSTANFHDYRTFWRLEAALEHFPMPGVGSRLLRYYDLPLIRYDNLALPLPALCPPPVTHALCLQTTKPRAPVVRYNISTPTVPVGPHDIIFSSLFLQPLDPGVSVRSATLVIERRIDLHSTPAYDSSTSISSTSSSAPSTPDYLTDNSFTPTTGSPLLSPYSSDSPRSVHDVPPSPSSSTSPLDDNTTSTSRFLSPTPSSYPPTLSIPDTRFTSPYATTPVDLPRRTLTATVASAEDASFTCDSSGVWSSTITLQWPAPRSLSRWALGETLHSDFASVRFFIKTKVLIASAAGVEALELEERELAVTATNEAERELALAKYNEQREAAQRSKSKSPWRRRERDADASAAAPHGYAHTRSLPASAAREKFDAEQAHAHHHHRSEPPPGRSSVSSARKDMYSSNVWGSAMSAASGSAKPPTGTRKLKTPRRPHTSAGPRDKSNFPYAARAEVGLNSSPDASAEVGAAARRPKESGLGESMLFARDRSRETRARKRESGSRELGGKAVELDHVRAWEEELKRIELQSRRSSAGMRGLWGLGRRKQLAQTG